MSRRKKEPDARALIQFIADHEVSQSIYIADPDGNNIELYVDADPAVWRERPERVANVHRLVL